MSSQEKLTRLVVFHGVLFCVAWPFAGWQSFSSPLFGEIALFQIANSVQHAQWLLLAIVAALGTSSFDRRFAALTMLLVLPTWLSGSQAINSMVGWYVFPALLSPLITFAALIAIRKRFWQPVWFKDEALLPAAEPMQFSILQLMALTGAIAVTISIFRIVPTLIGPWSVFLLGPIVSVAFTLACVWATLRPNRPQEPLFAVLVIYPMFLAILSLARMQDAEGSFSIVTLSGILGGLASVLLVAGSLLVMRRCGFRILPIGPAAEYQRLITPVS